MIIRVKSSCIARCLAGCETFLETRRNRRPSGWARVLRAATIGFAVSVASTADAPVAHTSPVLIVVARPDPRIARLESFFKGYRCSTPYYASEYLRVADRYGLDYRLLPAVSIRETLCGQAERHANNLWGYHQESFASIQAGIEFLAERLTQHPYYKGKTLLEKLFTYNPKPAYPSEIDRIMRKIE